MKDREPSDVHPAPERRTELPTAVKARCPNRIDLAGGTIDLYPLYLILGKATTVNVAVSLSSTVEVELIDDPGVHITSVDQHAEGVLAPGQLPEDGPLALAARAVAAFWSGGGVSVRTHNEAPKGSGLGASSALLVALARALCELDGRRHNPHQLIHIVSEVEAGLIGIPTGRQDYYAALFGGLQQLEFSAGKVRRKELPLGRRVNEWLTDGMVVAFTGEAHFSGAPNWEVIKAAVDGDREVRARLRRIGEAASMAVDALRDADWEGLCAAVRADWAARQELHTEVTSPRLDALVEIACEAGAGAAKLCGAGGGGSLLALCPPERNADVRRALQRAGAMPLELAATRDGCTLECRGTTASAAALELEEESP